MMVTWPPLTTISGGQIAAHWPAQLLVPFVSFVKVYTVMPLSSARYWPSDELVFTVSVTEAGAVAAAEGVPVPLAELVAAGVPVVAAGVPVLAIVAALVAAAVPVAIEVAAVVPVAIEVAAVVPVAIEVAAVVPVAIAVAAVVPVAAEVAAVVAVGPVAGTAAVLVAVPLEEGEQAARNSIPIAISPNTRQMNRDLIFIKKRLYRCISFLLLHTINVYNVDNNTILIRF